MSYRFAGYAEPVPGFCDRPHKMVDVHTRSHHLARCKSARPSKCGPCSEVKRADIAAIGRSGWIDKPTDAAFFCTVTPPGAKVLRWDRALCHHSLDVRCSGNIGCQVDANDLARWHHDIGKRWSRVVEDLRRELNPGQTSLPLAERAVQVEYMRTWEPQQRQALHGHAMMRVSGVCSSKRFSAALKAAAIRHGFGPQTDVQVVNITDQRLAARAAGYIAKYNTKSADALPVVRRLDGNGVISYGGIRSWSASWNWGDTMRGIHERRCQWAAAHSAQVPGATGAAGGPGSGTGGAALDLNQELSATDIPSPALVSFSAAPIL
jgi:hypothetical protein